MSEIASFPTIIRPDSVKLAAPIGAPSGEWSEARQFIACQSVCEALAPIASSLSPAFQPLYARESGQKGTVLFGSAGEAQLITLLKGSFDAVSL